MYPRFFASLIIFLTAASDRSSSGSGLAGVCGVSLSAGAASCSLALALVATATLDAIPFSSLIFFCSALGSDLTSALGASLGAILDVNLDVIFGSILVAILGSIFGSTLEPAAFFGSLA